MDDFLSLLSALAGSLLDPVLLAGAVLVGWYLRPDWLAAAAAVGWNFLVYALMLELAYQDERHARFLISSPQYLGSCLAAILAALFARRLRGAAAAADGPTLARRALGLALALVAILAGWVACAPIVLNHFHDLYGKPEYWERSSLRRHFWAFDRPGYAVIVLAVVALLWLAGLARARRWPRSPLFLLATSVYIEFLFWAVLGCLANSHVP